MALTPIGLGSSPNDGNGDTLRSGGAKINTGFTQTDTNETDIATNVSDIADNAADIVLLQANPLIQYKFLDIAAGDVISSATTPQIATGLEVAITPISTTSSLIVSFAGKFETASAQNGVNAFFEYSTDNYVSSTLLYAARELDDTAITGRFSVSSRAEIVNTGIVNEIKCRLVFSAYAGGSNVTFMGTWRAFMDVSEMEV